MRARTKAELCMSMRTSPGAAPSFQQSLSMLRSGSWMLLASLEYSVLLVAVGERSWPMVIVAVARLASIRLRSIIPDAVMVIRQGQREAGSRSAPLQDAPFWLAWDMSHAAADARLLGETVIRGVANMPIMATQLLQFFWELRADGTISCRYRYRSQRQQCTTPSLLPLTFRSSPTQQWLHPAVAVALQRRKRCRRTQ